MKCMYLGKPSRNFCILASTFINDPMDGKEKIVLSNFVSGGTGRLIFIDTQNSEGESIELPGDEGAWALLCLNNEKLLVGTCGLKGYLHCLDLKSRTWAASLRDVNESYIWNLTQGSDGMVYGGTYPGCVLLRYDPEKHVLTNIGKMSQHSGNQYSRFVFGSVPGRIFINCGLQKQHAAVWDMKTCSAKAFGPDGAYIRKVNKDFICTVTGDELDFYDPVSLEPLNGTLSTSNLEACQLDVKTPISMFIEKLIQPEKDVRLPDDIGNVLALPNGDIAGVRGQEFFILKKKDTEFKLKHIPVEAPATQILTITAAPDGKLWGTSNFGQTIFNYDPGEGTYWNSATVCKRGGEVYGIRAINRKVFMAAYTGGDHIVYDPSMPWDQINNINPVTLKQVGPDLIRPHSKSVVGPDGAFWTGWMAKYGVYGGGLSRVDVDTYEIHSWYDPIPGQAIESLAAGEKYLYFTTSGLGNGLKTKIEPFYLCAWDTAGGIVHKIQFPEGLIPGYVEIAGNYGAVSIEDKLKIFDCNNMEFCSTIQLSGACTCMVNYNEDKVLVFCGKEMIIVSPEKGEARLAAILPGIVKTAAVNKSGEIFFVNTECLYKLTE